MIINELLREFTETKILTLPVHYQLFYVQFAFFFSSGQEGHGLGQVNK